MPLINKNGVYESWSNLFNFTSPVLFEISKQLPFPNSDPNSNQYRITGIREDNSIDITDNILNLLNGIYSFSEDSKTEERAQRLKLVSDVLNKIDLAKIPNASLYYNFEEILNNLSYILDESDNRGALLDRINTITENLLSDINKHNQETNPKRLLSAAKNFVYNKIYQISDSFKNLIAAESPISMSDPQAAAEKSTAGAYAKTVTNSSPSVLWNLFYENMAGKEVIGISAVGQKIFLAATQYFNQEIRRLNKEGLDVNKLIKSNIYFNHLYKIYKTNRTSDGKTEQELQNIFVNSLANINLEDIEYVYDLLEQASNRSISIQDVIKLTNNRFQNDVSLIISALISSATDNAKELILSKINAGPDLAGVYVYFLINGLSFDNISDLMTSNEVNSVVQANTVNRLYDNHSSIDSVIRKIKDPYSGLSILNYISNNYINTYRQYLSKFKDSDPNFDETALTVKDINTIIDDLNTTEEKFYPKLDLDEETIALLSEFMDEGSESADTRKSDEFKKGLIRYLKDLRRFVSIHDEIYSNPSSETNFNTFANAYSEAQELTILGRILGINGGIKTKQYDRYNFFKSFEQLFTNAIKRLDPSGDSIREIVDSIETWYNDRGMISPYTTGELTIITTNALNLMSSTGTLSDLKFDLGRFISDPLYKDTSTKFYNVLKSTINVLDLIDKLPHYKAFLEAYYVNEQNSKLASIKYDLQNQIIDNLEDSLMRIKAGDIKMRGKLNEKQISTIRDYVDELIIHKYLKYKNLTISVPKGQNYFKDKALVTASNPTSFSLSTEDGLASFKLYMESYVIPMLKNGYTINTRGVMVRGKELFNNEFLNKLIITDRASSLDGSLYTYYRPSMNMMNTLDNPEFDKLVAAFGAIENVEFRGIKLSDLFFIYNLITHKGRKGQDSIIKILQGSVFNPSSLIVDYHKYIGSVDYNTADPTKIYDSNSDKITMDDVNLTDILLRLAPIKDSFEELISNNKYVKVYDESLGKYKIQEAVLNEKGRKIYKDVTINGDSKYYLLRDNIISNIKTPESESLYSKALDLNSLIFTLMESNKIKLILNC